MTGHGASCARRNGCWRRATSAPSIRRLRAVLARGPLPPALEADVRLPARSRLRRERRPRRDGRGVAGGAAPRRRRRALRAAADVWRSSRPPPRRRSPSCRRNAWSSWATSPSSSPSALRRRWWPTASIRVSWGCTTACRWRSARRASARRAPTPIRLFRANLERVATSRAALLARIRLVVLHETALLRALGGAAAPHGAGLIRQPGASRPRSAGRHPASDPGVLPAATRLGDVGVRGRRRPAGLRIRARLRSLRSTRTPTAGSHRRVDRALRGRPLTLAKAASGAHLPVPRVR